RALELGPHRDGLPVELDGFAVRPEAGQCVGLSRDGVGVSAVEGYRRAVGLGRRLEFPELVKRTAFFERGAALVGLQPQREVEGACGVAELADLIKCVAFAYPREVVIRAELYRPVE